MFFPMYVGIYRSCDIVQLYMYVYMKCVYIYIYIYKYIYMRVKFLGVILMLKFLNVQNSYRCFDVKKFLDVSNFNP